MTVTGLFTRLRREGTAQPVAMVCYLATGAVGAVSDGVTGAFAAGSELAAPEPVVSDFVTGGLAAVLVLFPPHVTQAMPADKNDGSEECSRNPAEVRTCSPLANWPIWIVHSH